MQPKTFLQNTPLPKTEARMLLQAVTGWTRAQLITRDGETLDEGQTADLQSMQQRRLNGEPMAYILGWREFYGRRFRTTPATLIPRPETEHLVEAALQHLPPQGRVWDLGTGSGAVAVTLACERPDASVLASDISPAALAVARQNAADNGADVSFACGSWFDIDRPFEKHSFNLLVSNPPYIEADDGHLQQGDLRFEPANALTDFSDGLSCIRELAARGAEYLKPGGRLIMEHGWNQGAAVRQILEAEGWTEIETQTDLAGLERITQGRKAV